MTALPSTYKAYLQERVGPVEDVLQLREVPMEPLPPAHVRIQVHSAALNPVDWKVAQIGAKIFNMPDPTPEQPLRIGWDVAGVVVEVADDVSEFRVGDEVFAMTSKGKFGSLAEYLAVGAAVVARKPTTLDFDHAAGVPLAALTSYQALKQPELGNLKAGERVLILGGSSGTGTFAVQYAKAVGAYVIATASAKNADLVKSLGADEVVDYRTQQWGDVIAAHSVDVIYDCGVEPDSWEDAAQRVLKKDSGRFVTIGLGKNPSPAKFGASRSMWMTNPSGKDLTEIAALFDAGKVKLVVDSVFPLEKTVDAFMRLKTGHAVGKVIVKVI
jgi:NADPH:quinone reductase-like Zn-dependent oxidoreductase